MHFPRKLLNFSVLILALLYVGTVEAFSPEEIRLCETYLSQIQQINDLNAAVDPEVRAQAQLPISIWVQIQHQRLHSPQPSEFELDRAEISANHWVYADAEQALTRKVELAEPFEKYRHHQARTDLVIFDHIRFEILKRFQKLEAALKLDRTRYGTMTRTAHELILVHNLISQIREALDDGREFKWNEQPWNYLEDNLDFWRRTFSDHKSAFSFSMPVRGNFGFSAGSALLAVPLKLKGISPPETLQADGSRFHPAWFTDHDNFHAIQIEQMMANSFGSGWVDGNKPEDFELVLRLVELDHRMRNLVQHLESSSAREAIYAANVYLKHERTVFLTPEFAEPFFFVERELPGFKRRSVDGDWGLRSHQDIDFAIQWLRQFHITQFKTSAAFSFQMKRWIDSYLSREAPIKMPPTEMLEAFTKLFFGSPDNIENQRRAFDSVLTSFGSDYINNVVHWKRP